jgi:hypothetical protein
MSTPAGWYPDPTGRHQNRWFDGDDWTDSVADGQTVATDPVKGGGAPGAAGAGATQVISTQPQAQPPAPGASVGPTQPTPAAGPPPIQPSPVAGIGGSTLPPGAPGASAASGPPLGPYTAPPGAPPAGGGKSKTGLIVAVAVILIAVVVGVVLLTQGGDDGGGDTAADRSDQDQSDDVDQSDDPSASDLFDDMADEAGDSSDDVFGTDDEPSDEPSDTTAGGEYPQEVIDNFNSSCTGAGGPVDFCQCIIDDLQETVAYDRFVEIDAQLAENPDDIPPELDASVARCQSS